MAVLNEDTAKKLRSGELKLGEFLGIDTNQYAAVLLAGHTLFTEGRFNDARRLFEGMAVLDSRNPYVQGMLGAIYQKEGKDKAAIAYGRATADQIKMVTDGLLKSGQFKVAQKMHPGLSDAETIRMMQWDHGVGIDCAGYVQQAFMDVHGGGRADFGFKTFGNEDLMSLKNNPHFKQVKPEDIKPGDLIALNPPSRGDVGHTVLVRDHHVATADEMKSFQDPGGFAKSGDKVHVMQVDASWGAGEDGSLEGGVQTRVWLYNENTRKWADATPDGKGGYTVSESTKNGPYNHPMNGIFRPKRSA